MNKKFKVKYYYEGEESSKYKVTIKDWACSELTVKNISRGLYPQFYGQVECTIKNIGNELRVKTELNEFVLDYAEAEVLLTALMIEYIYEGKSQMVVEIKQKGVCTCIK